MPLNFYIRTLKVYCLAKWCFSSCCSAIPFHRSVLVTIPLLLSLLSIIDSYIHTYIIYSEIRYGESSIFHCGHLPTVSPRCHCFKCRLLVISEETQLRDTHILSRTYRRIQAKLGLEAIRRCFIIFTVSKVWKHFDWICYFANSVSGED